MVDSLRERVRHERWETRRWSFDRAVNAARENGMESPVNGETWRKWERGDTAELTEIVGATIAAAFGWPTSWWQESSAANGAVSTASVTQQLDEMRAEIQRLATLIERRQAP